jgi:SAM-dependent methyltransferase
MKTLSIGSGRKQAAVDLVRLDISPEANPDVVWDLRKTPWPFENSTFEFIECNDVIEHLPEIPEMISECHRVLKPGGVLRMTTPHFSSAYSWRDPTHKFHLSYFSFDVFSDEHEYSYYSKARFKIRHREIRFEGLRIRTAILRRIANAWPDFFERRLAWTFPAWFLYFELEAIK